MVSLMVSYRALGIREFHMWEVIYDGESHGILEHGESNGILEHWESESFTCISYKTI